MTQICTEKELPFDPVTQLKAYAIAKASNLRNIPEANIHHPVSLALVRNKIHKVGMTLNVAFMNGTDRQQQNVITIAKEWEKHANIKLNFYETGDLSVSHIRIAFKWNDDGGSWSYLGTDNLLIPKDRPTMNYGWLHDNSALEEYERVVLHEFGHALAAIHEHQNPSVNIQWDREKVYEYYARTNGWDRETVDINIFRKYSQDITQFSQFDKHSIMLYSIHNSLTLDDFEVGFNRQLSAMDKEFIGVCYPFEQKPTNPFPIINIGETIKARLDKWLEEDYYQFDLNRDASQKISIQTKGKIDTVVSLMDAATQTVIAWDDDSGQNRNAHIVKVLNKGKYLIRVRHYSKKGKGNYSISLREVV